MTDTKQALIEIKRNKIKSKLVQEISKTIRICRERCKIDIRWVKGHNNNTGNEYADALAKK